MSDEIYVGAKPSNKGCLILVGVMLLLCLLVAGAIWKVRRPAPRREQTPVPTTAQQEQVAGAPASKVTPVAPQPTEDSTSLLFEEAQKLKSANQLLECREKLYELLARSQHASLREEAIKMLGAVNIMLALTPRNMPEKIEHVVQPGDSLIVLARKYGTTADAIRKGNGLSGTVIRVNDRLRILNGKFRISISKSQNILDLYLNDRLFKRYRVGTGEYGKTPEGDFVIVEKIPQPTWWKDGKAIPYGHPDNVLGTHWMSVNVPGYGIHGTWEPDTIGKQASAGCVRLLNEDIEELFTLVPEGTPVTIGP